MPSEETHFEETASDRTPPENNVAVVLCTSPPDDAERLAVFLVEKRHAACVNIVPGITSVYSWQGKIERDGESLLVIKCPAGGVQQLSASLIEEHPYEVPEVIALPVQGGNAAYLKWVLETTMGA